jgi:hypothetical protein
MLILFMNTEGRLDAFSVLCQRRLLGQIVRLSSYRSQPRHLNLESWLPDATEDDISLVSQTLLGLA